MKGINDLLLRYKNITTPNASVIKITIQSVKKYTNIQLTKKNISIHSNNIAIKAPSVIKNEILFFKKEIEKEIHLTTTEKITVYTIL